MIDNLLNAFIHLLIPTFNISTAMPERHVIGFPSSEKIIFLSLTAKLGGLIADGKKPSQVWVWRGAVVIAKK